MKRKWLNQTLAMVVAVPVMVCACGEENDNDRGTIESVKQEEEETEKPTEQLPQEEVVEVTEEIADTEPTVDYEKLYEPVFSELDELFQNGYDYDKEYHYVPMGVIENIMYNDPDLVQKGIGYIFLDINGDDISELLIGENVTDGMTNVKYAILYGGYSLIDDQPFCFLDGYARSSYQWMGNGKFFYFGSNSAFSSMYGVCSLDPNGQDLLWDDFYFSEERDGESVYFHNTTGIVDMEQSEELDVDGQDFWNKMDEFPAEAIEFEHFDTAASE